MRFNRNKRLGSVAVFLCFLMLPLLGLLALSVDYGFLLYVRTDLQRSADQAALAGVRDLIPDAYGNQDLEKAKATIRDYIAKNLGDEFQVLETDIEFGKINNSKIYNSVEFLETGLYDTVRISIRNDSFANHSISLYFARLFDKDDSDVSVTSTAILQPARYLGPGTAILPIAVELDTWNSIEQGEAISVYGDGRIENEFGSVIPGNWGTVDIGTSGNSTADLKRQIEVGINESDLASLNQQNRTPSPDRIDSQQPMTVNADTGFSAGIKNSVILVEGQTRLMPIYDTVYGNGGNNVEFRIVGWAVVQIVDSRWNGSQNTYVQVRKSFRYDGHLEPVRDLSDTTNVIEGAFTSPVLVE